MDKADDVKRELNIFASQEKAKSSAWFFKTGKGQYGEGDVFIGVTVPQIRVVVKKYKELPRKEVLMLLHSHEHEFRLCALFILVWQFKKGKHTQKEKIFKTYIANTKWVNNWDLVDLSAPTIIGEYLVDKDKSILSLLAKSYSVWERRIAVLATFAFIRTGKTEMSFTIAKHLLHDDHDLIQKAVGWMLREIGKRVGEDTERKFLDQYYKTMPRTMLRYAIEKFPEKLRKQYLVRD